MKTTFHIIYFIILVLAFLMCKTPAPSVSASTTELEFINLFASTNIDSIACYRIPAIVTAPNGDLIVTIDERVPSCGDLKWSEDINIVQRRSRDNGKTWTEIERVIDHPLGQSASDPSMIVDNISGDIIMLYNYMDHGKEKDVYYLRMVRSSDNGITWSEPQDITDQITKAAWHNDFKFITSGRGIQTSDGMLVHTLVNLDNGLHLFASDDHGENWRLLDTPLIPANESKIVELNDGSWMVNCRDNGAGIRHIHLSKDKGKSWEHWPDSTLVDPGCNASIIRYTSIAEGADKNRLLFSNANDPEARKNLSIKISYDEGESWSEGKTIYTAEAAYSTMTVLQNGDIGIVFEKDDYKENVFVRISLDWLTDGKDHLSREQKEAFNKH